MRIKVDFVMNTNWLTKDYRRIFMSLLKNALNEGNQIYSTLLYGTEKVKRKVNKPFTFSIYFPEFEKITSNTIYCGKKVSIFYSSNDPDFITNVYNGFEKKKIIEIGQDSSVEFKLQNIRMLQSPVIHDDKIIFRTLSPILVNIEETNTYIDPTHPNFASSFQRVIKNQLEAFNLTYDENSINYDIKSMKKLPLTHYNQTMTSWLGEFVLTAPTSALQLVYDIGIGVRRSQGFGMLEIVKQY